MKSGHPHPWHGAERLVHPNHCEGPPGGQVVKILRFQCRGSDQGTKLLIIHSMMWQAPIFFLTEKKKPVWVSYAQSIFKVPSFEITYNEIKKEHQRSGTGNCGFRGVTRIARKGSFKEEKVGKNVKCHREDGPGKDPLCPRGLTFTWHASLGASQVALVVKNPPANARDIRDMGSIRQEDPLKEGMVTRSSIFPWRIPWTEEPGRLQSIGLPRVGHNWSDLACTPVDLGK